MLAWYLLKVILCSAILCGYYFLTLRDKVFHKWNRFYILFSIMLALLLPITTINIFQNNSNQNGIAQIIKNINNTDDTIVQIDKGNTINLWIIKGIEIGYLGISITFAFMLIIGIFKIQQWKRRFPQRVIFNIRFFDTDLKNAPCSFFKSIFWNNSIELNSPTGRQILNHELTHVKQLHSHDKIFVNIVLVFFWINPVFWLFKKELYMIHEFIADHQASQNNPGTSYCETILQTLYPGRDLSITNNFFYSPLKRRLLMLTKHQNPKTNYIGRAIAIPLLLFTISAFTLKIRHASSPDIIPSSIKQDPALIANKGFQNKVRVVTDTIPDIVYKNKKVQKVDINSKDGFVTIHYADGTTQKMSKKQFAKSNFPPPPPPPPVPGQVPPPPPLPANVMYVVDGQIAIESEWKNIPPESIESINVLKNKDAVDKYGEKGRNGVVEIITKKSYVGKKSPLSQNPSYGAPEQKGTSVNDMLFTKVENEATFPGGQSAWNNFIANAIKANINKLGSKDNGTCLIRFIVEMDGSLTNVEALTMKNTSFSEVAIEAIKTGPKWIPATQNGHIVRAYREQPVSFKMQDQ